MANAGKEVVLYLEVEPAGKPGDDLVLSRKIGGGDYLVNGPLIFNLQLIICLHVFESCIFYHMGQLEYDGQGDTHHNVHAHESDKPGHPAHHECGDEDIEQYVQYLADPEDEMLSPIHFLQGCVYDLSFEVFVEIEHQHPGQGGNGVYGQHVNVLEAVCRHPFLGGAHAHEGAFIDVVIHTVYIGVGVVDDIVFEFPDEGIATEGVEGEAHDVVDPLFAGVTAMAGIVHDIKADTGQQEAQ